MAFWWSVLTVVALILPFVAWSRASAADRRASDQRNRLSELEVRLEGALDAATRPGGSSARR